MTPETTEPQSPRLNITPPDPAELQRRWDDDQTIQFLTARISEMEQEASVRKSTGAKESAPLRTENRDLARKRSELLRKIRSNDAKLRSISDKVRLEPQGLRIARSKLKARKNVIRERLVKLMLCGAREQLHRELKAGLREAPPNPPPPPSSTPEPPAPTEPTTPTPTSEPT